MSRVVAWIKKEVAAVRHRLVRIEDTPHSIALGSAIGMFFGFTPLFGLKTLLSILTAWIFRSSKLASAITVTLHDVFLPAAPVIYYWEFQMGMWILHGRFSRRPRFGHMVLRDYMEWTTFFTLGRPMLVGSIFLALPSALLVYFFLRTLLTRARREPPAPD